MAVIAYVVLPGVTKERHDQIRAEVGWLEEPPVGGISRATPRGVRPAGGEDHRLTPDAGSFSQRLWRLPQSVPILQQIGMDPGQPIFKSSHNGKPR